MDMLAGALAFCAVYLAWGDVARVRAPHLARLRATRLWRLVRERGEGLVLRARAAPKAAERADVGQALPEMLDLVGMGLSAGLSFDAALAEYCHESPCALASGLRAAMLSWQMGFASRGEALEQLSVRLGEPGIARFAASVTEAIELGTPLAATLERQARLARDEQRARVEERIERVPVKMLVPMGTLVVPSMLLAIVGPLVAAMGGGL